jgi:hypothetical protein
MNEMDLKTLRRVKRRGDEIASALAFVPRTVPAARQALAELEKDIGRATTYAQIRRAEKRAEAFKVVWREIDEVRQDAERVILVARLRIGEEETKLVSPRGRPSEKARSAGLYSTTVERHGSKQKSQRVRKLAEIGKAKVLQIMGEIHEKGKEATQSAVIKAANAETTQLRRAASRSAPPLPGDPEVRIGDCRIVLADVADNSVAMILTDPPYGDDAEPLYRWLGQFAKRVLVPGGSLICFTGNVQEFRDLLIFHEAGLDWNPRLTQRLDQAQRFVGKYNMIFEDKPVLWFTKGPRRDIDGHRVQIPNGLHGKKDKSEHDWAQGESGVTNLIHDLTEPGELIVDPFAGAALWGRIAKQAGRNWLGADLERGGDTRIVA